MTESETAVDKPNTGKLGNIQDNIKVHSVTQLQEVLVQIDQLGAEEKNLSAHLRQLAARFDMRGIQRLVESLRS